MLCFTKDTETLVPFCHTGKGNLYPLFDDDDLVLFLLIFIKGAWYLSCKIYNFHTFSSQRRINDFTWQIEMNYKMNIFVSFKWSNSWIQPNNISNDLCSFNHQLFHLPQIATSQNKKMYIPKRVIQSKDISLIIIRLNEHLYRSRGKSNVNSRSFDGTNKHVGKTMHDIYVILQCRNAHVIRT